MIAGRPGVGKKSTKDAKLRRTHSNPEKGKLKKLFPVSAAQKQPIYCCPQSDEANPRRGFHLLIDEHIAKDERGQKKVKDGNLRIAPAAVRPSIGLIVVRQGGGVIHQGPRGRAMLINPTFMFRFKRDGLVHIGGIIVIFASLGKPPPKDKNRR